jgi:hypothetical protein
MFRRLAMPTLVLTKDPEVVAHVFSRLRDIGDLFVHEILSEEECELLDILQYRTVRFAFAHLSVEGPLEYKEMLKKAIIAKYKESIH